MHHNMHRHDAPVNASTGRALILAGGAFIAALAALVIVLLR
jgi:hypothetical protein